MSLSNLQYRYPGLMPFETENYNMYFGRARQVSELAMQIRVEPMVVVYGKSGIGKSSLLNAGVIPVLNNDKNTLALRIRFNTAGFAGHSPQTALQTTLEEAIEAHRKSLGLTQKTDLHEVLGLDEFRLWSVIKSWQIDTRDQYSVVLVFDQFEEIFTYAEEEVTAFSQLLSTMLYAYLPIVYRERFFELYANGVFNKESAEIFEQAFRVKAVLAVRSDRLSLLDRMNENLPAILSRCYELRALTREQAREAIIGPASLPGNFAVPPFSYTAQAIETIIDSLSNGKSDVESFQLQIICHNIEKMVAEGRIPDRNNDGLPDVDEEDLGGIQETIAHYYQERIGSLFPGEQLLARRVIEEGLVVNDRRVSVDAAVLSKTFGIDQELLSKLESNYLIRREPNLFGGYNFELAHDTLIAPVNQAKEQRLVEEQKVLLQQEFALARKALEEEKVKRKRSQRLLFIALSLAIFSIAASFFAFWSYRQAQNARTIAEQRYVELEKNQMELKREQARVKIANADAYIRFAEYVYAVYALEDALKIDSSQATKMEVDSMLRIIKK